MSQAKLGGLHELKGQSSRVDESLCGGMECRSVTEAALERFQLEHKTIEKIYMEAVRQTRHVCKERAEIYEFLNRRFGGFVGEALTDRTNQMIKEMLEFNLKIADQVQIVDKLRQQVGPSLRGFMLSRPGGHGGGDPEKGASDIQATGGAQAHCSEPAAGTCHLGKAGDKLNAVFGN